MDEPTPANRDEIAGFYDVFNDRLVRDYIYGNPRIGAAIERVCRNLPSGPIRVLDIGSGLGHSSSCYARSNPEAQVLGVDISPRNVEVASRLFGSDRVSFEVSNLQDGVISGPFDVIAMLDVHEHLPRPCWEDVHQRMAEWLSPTGVVVLTTPSPEHQTYLADHEPEGLQVVDETLELEDFAAIARRLDARLIHLDYVDAWCRADYVHAVYARDVRYREPANRAYWNFSKRVFRRLRRVGRGRQVQRALGNG